MLIYKYGAATFAGSRLVELWFALINVVLARLATVTAANWCSVDADAELLCDEAFNQCAS